MRVCLVYVRNGPFPQRLTCGAVCCCRMSRLHPLIFYLRGIACGFTMAFCLHESVDTQHKAYRHTPTNSFEAVKIAVAVCFLAVVNLSARCVPSKKQMDQNKADRKTEWKSYNCALWAFWEVAGNFCVLSQVG